MKVIINNINIYVNSGYKGTMNFGASKTFIPDVNDFCPHIVVNDNVLPNDNALLERLKERLMQSGQELNDLIDKLNSETI